MLNVRLRSIIRTFGAVDATQWDTIVNMLAIGSSTAAETTSFTIYLCIPPVTAFHVFQLDIWLTTSIAIVIQSTAWVPTLILSLCKQDEQEHRYDTRGCAHCVGFVRKRNEKAVLNAHRSRWICEQWSLCYFRSMTLYLYSASVCWKYTTKISLPFLFLVVSSWTGAVTN